MTEDKDLDREGLLRMPRSANLIIQILRLGELFQARVKGDGPGRAVREMPHCWLERWAKDLGYGPGIWALEKTNPPQQPRKYSSPADILL